MRVIFTLLVAAVAAIAQPAKPEKRKFAFLIGVGDYKHEGAASQLGALPVNDVAAMKKILEADGYRVALFTDAAALKKDLEAAYARILKGQIKATDPVNALGYHDTLIVHLCGHGIQVEATDPDDPDRKKKMQPFLRVHDSKSDDTDTMIPLNRLIRDAAASKVRAMFLVDACRVNSDPNLRGRSGITAGKVELPEGISILYSCNANQVAQQDQKLGHGLFTYAVLKTLRGETGRKEDVSWDDLVADVKKAFRSDSEILKSLGTNSQSPTSPQGDNEYSLMLTLPRGVGGEKTASAKLSVYTGEPPLLQSPFTSKEIADSRAHHAAVKGLPRVRETKYGHILPLIVPGTFRMGADEPLESAMKLFPIERAKTFANEHPPRRATVGTPFYMAQSEVTVAQFRAFVRATGYETDQERKAASKNTTGAESSLDDATWANAGHDNASDDQPVTHVTANDAKAYCNWLSKEEGRTYRLPTPVEWEYACRAGTTSRYWIGDNPELLAGIANVPDGSVRRLEQKKLDTCPDHQAYYTAAGEIFIAAGYEQGKPIWTSFAFQAGSRIDLDFTERQQVLTFKQPRITVDATVKAGQVRIVNNHGRQSNRIALTDPAVDAAAREIELQPGQSQDLDYKDVGLSYAITTDDGFTGLAPVMKFKANPFGLFDMHGNVWELCEDPDAAKQEDRWFNRGGCFL